MREPPAFSIMVSSCIAEVNVLTGPEFDWEFSPAVSFFAHEFNDKNARHSKTGKLRALINSVTVVPPSSLPAYRD